MINAERIKNLSNEELAGFIRNVKLLSCSATCAYADFCKHDGVEEDFCQLGTRLWVEQKCEEKQNELGN